MVDTVHTSLWAAPRCSHLFKSSHWTPLPSRKPDVTYALSYQLGAAYDMSFDYICRTVVTGVRSILFYRDVQFGSYII